MSSDTTMRVILTMCVMVVLVLCSAITFECGRHRILDGLLSDGFKVTVSALREPGEGRYTVERYRDGMWVGVER